MSRVPYITDESASPEVQELFDAALYATGRVSNLQRILAQVPWLYRWHFPLAATAQKDIGLLPPDEKAIAHIRAAAVSACSY